MRLLAEALALGMLAAAPAAAEVAPYPPAWCAAFWHGYADVLGDAGETALADGFRAASARLEGAAATDAAIAEQRPLMVALIRAYVHDQDDQSRDLFERLVQGCGVLAADFAETRSLR